MGNLKHDLDDRIKALAVSEVDVIFVSDRYLFERISKLKVAGVKKQIQVMYVTDVKDLRCLSVVAMREMGWVRDPKAVAREGSEPAGSDAGTQETAAPLPNAL